jgi:hypothetical protein
VLVELGVNVRVRQVRMEHRDHLLEPYPA